MNKKICSECEEEKLLKHFNFRNRLEGTRHSYCATCGKLKTRLHYTNNKEYYKAKAKKNDKTYYTKCRHFLSDYLSNNPCVDCGESDLDVLEFDHVNGSKLDSISNLIRNVSLDKIKKEIEKCEVRCANCHRRKTIKQFGHFSYKNLVSLVG